MDVASGSPVLVQEGLVDPGPGVATFFPSAAIDPAGNIGMSYMQSSSTEFVSAYVAGHVAGTPLGSTSPGVAFGVGAALEAVSFRNGDYGTAVYDPGTGLFWAANEYAGADASATSGGPRSRRSVCSPESAPITTRSTPTPVTTCTSRPRRRPADPTSSSTTSIPSCLLYDPNGNLVAIANGNAADGRNSVIDFTVPDGDAGNWIIEVTPSPTRPRANPGRVRPAGDRGDRGPGAVRR